MIMAISTSLSLGISSEAGGHVRCASRFLSLQIWLFTSVLGQQHDLVGVTQGLYVRVPFHFIIALIPTLSLSIVITTILPESTPQDLGGSPRGRAMRKCHLSSRQPLLFLKEDVSEEVMYSLLIFPHSVMSKGLFPRRGLMSKTWKE